MNFNFNRTEHRLAATIIDRYAALIAPRAIDRRSLLMDLDACHSNGAPLDLVKLAAARDSDLLHDVGGIRSHLDRETGQLRDLFSPRCAARVPA